MYEQVITVDEIRITVSYHEALKQAIEKFNSKQKELQAWDTKLDQKKILRMILSNGENILSLKNDSEFILVDSFLKIGIACSIYTTGQELEIEVSEIFKNYIIKSDEKIRNRKKIDGCNFTVYRAS